MTEDTIALRALLEKGSDATFLREMIGFAAQRLMELETEGLCGAGPGERSPQRLNQRNGYRDRNWETRAGTVELRLVCAVDDRQRRIERVRDLPAIAEVAAAPGREPGAGDRMACGGRCDCTRETIGVEPACDAHLEVDRPRLVPMIQIEVQLVERVEPNGLHCNP